MQFRKRVAMLCGCLVAILLMSTAFAVFAGTVGNAKVPGMQQTSNVEGDVPDNNGNCPSTAPLRCDMGRFQNDPHEVYQCCPQGYPYTFYEMFTATCYDNYQEAQKDCGNDCDGVVTCQ